jgi:hypothetical protein
MRGTRRLTATALVVLLACSDAGITQEPPGPQPPPPPPPGDTTPGDIRVDAGTQFQTITGWEAHVQAGQEHAQFASFRDALFDQAVNDLGITRLRIEPLAGFEHSRDLADDLERGLIDYPTYRCLRYTTVNDNADPFVIDWSGFHFSHLDSYIENTVIPLRQRLAARGEALYVVATYVAFSTGGCPPAQYHHTDPEEYAEFVLATYQHMQQKYGFVPDAWEVILEPDNTSFWRGPQIGRAMVAAGKRLQQHGFTPRFIAPSNRSMAAAISYFDAMVAIPGALDHLSEFAYHRYGGVSDANLQAIGQRAVQYGIRTSMLEHIGSGYEDLHKDLALGRASAWQQFALAFPTSDNGAQYFVLSSGGAVQPGSRTRYLRQYFRYVRPGAVRIGAQSASNALDPLAFINPGGRYAVVVKADAAATFTVQGLPAGLYGVTFTTATATHVAGPDATVASGGLLNASIPGRGVLTIYRR